MGKRKLSDYDDNESDDDICVNSRPSKISCFEKGCYSAENGGDYVNVNSGYFDDDEAAAEDKEKIRVAMETFGQRDGLTIRRYTIVTGGLLDGENSMICM
nr:hypothetical protein [Tanacetum cinerariifolium]